MDAVVQIGADVKQALRGIDQLNNRLKRVDRSSAKSAQSMKRLEGAASRVSGALTAAATAFAGFAIQRGIRGIVDATLQMESFQTQLTAYLGSQRLANFEIERLSKLARGLPQDVNELTAAFVIFQRNGLDTSNESMTAFARIAAGNSKSITQLGEAVADALTGEYERLKEFGVKVAVENDGLVARFADGTQKTVRNSQELIQVLKGMGMEGGKFANITAGTLTQALSNLRGAVFETSVALGKQGLTQAIADVAKSITSVIDQNPQLVREIGVNLTKAFLTVVAVGKFVVANLELIGKIMILILKIKIAMFFLNAATALINFGKAIFSIGGILLGFGKRILDIGKFLIMLTPAGRIGRVVLAGIAALGAAWAWLRGETKDTADATQESVEGIGSAFANMLDLPSLKGLDQLEQDMANITAEAERLQKLSEETAAAMTEQEAAAARTAMSEQAKAEAAEAASASISQTLIDRLEELRISGLTAEQQEAIKIQKEIEKNIGRDLTAQEKERVALVAERIKLEQKANQIRDEFIDNSIVGLLQEQKLTDELFEKREQYLAEQAAQYGIDLQTRVNYYGSAMTLEEQFLSTLSERRTQASTDLQERLYELEYNRITDLYQYELETGRKLYSEKEKQALRYATQERQRQQDMQEAARSRVEFDMKSETEKAQWAINQGAEVFNQLGTYNKKAFEAAKAFNIASAIMNTYTGATKALASYPPPFNFIAAAGVVAMGLAQVASIRSQTYSGRQLGGPVMNGTSYLVGENGPEMFTPTTNGSITRNGNLNTGEAVNVNFNITANDASGFDDLLLQRRGMITQMVSDAIQDRGQRSML